MKNKKYIMVIYFFLITLFILGWHTAMSNSQAMDNTNFNKPEKYFFEMDKKNQEELFKKLNSLKIGDSVQKVKNILGAPTYDRKIASKDGKFIARQLLYYIKILKKDLVNEKYDKYITLYFDEKNLLVEIKSNAEVIHR